MTVDTQPRLSDPDALFAALVAAHDGLSPDASRAFDARLVLLLANHIGDMGVLLDAIRLASQSAPGMIDTLPSRSTTA